MNKPIADLGFLFPLRSVGGRLEFILRILGGSLKLSSSGLAFSMTNQIDSFIYQKFLLAQGSVLVLCTDRRSGLGLTPLFGDRRGFMPPQLKTKVCIDKR